MKMRTFSAVDVAVSLPSKDRTYCLCCLQDAACRHRRRQVARVKRKRTMFEYRLSLWPIDLCQLRGPRRPIRGNGSRFHIARTYIQSRRARTQRQRPKILTTDTSTERITPQSAYAHRVCTQGRRAGE